MIGLKHLAVVGTILIATAYGCGDNQNPPTSSTSGQIQILVPSSPGSVTRIHVAVTALDITGSVDTDLTKQLDGSWTGNVLDVPPGAGRTVTAEAFEGLNNTFEGIANGVTVFAGKLTDISITLKPTGGNTFPGINTPPHFTSVIYPPSVLSDTPASLSVTAADPDANTLLTYTWTVLSGGGSLTDDTSANQTPGDPVSNTYTPALHFTGFAVIQVAVDDGTATTITTFAIAIGAGLVPAIHFDVLPDLTVSGVDHQSLMPGGATVIHYGFTNPTQPWNPTTMHVQTSWSDSCSGSSFSTPTETVNVTKSAPESRTVTYTASSTAVLGPTRCRLKLEVSDAASVDMFFTIDVWIDPPMTMFVSSTTITGGQFGGMWQAADSFCQTRADSLLSAVPPGTYHALLSFDEISAKDRLIDAPYIGTDGLPIAFNKAELFSLTLLNAIVRDEKNADNSPQPVFTGTVANGSKGQNCLNWTSTDGDDEATGGLSGSSATPDWTNSDPIGCPAHAPIYCVQQPNLEL